MPELLSEILERCRRGDESAVAELVRRFQPWAVDFAKALLDDEHLHPQAQQAVQRGGGELVEGGHVEGHAAMLVRCHRFRFAVILR